MTDAKDGGLLLYRDGKAVFSLGAPLIEVNGKEQTMILRTDAEGAFPLWTADGLCCTQTSETVGEGLTRVTRTLRNTGRSTRVFKWIMEGETGFSAEKTTIPCVSFDGNRRSDGKEPHGTACDGERWIHAYDRMSIPSCTVSEDADTVVAMFASDRDAASLVSSASFDRLPDGRMVHRIYYPVTEAPYTYSDHDVMCARYDTYLTLRPGECFACEFFLFAGTPKWRHYGMATVLDMAIGHFSSDHPTPLPPETVWDTSLAWSESLLIDLDGVKMFQNYLRHDPDGTGFRPNTPGVITIEAGWSGQCFLQARMFISQFIRTGEKRYLDDALSCLDAWMETQMPCGLFPTNYMRHLNKKYVPNDVCNFSWGAAEAVRAARLLRSLGIERPRYIAFARGVMDFLISQYNDGDGFGLSYTVFGEKKKGGGTIGGFAVMALIELYRETREERYLSFAVRAYDDYFRRDLDDFICTAGALDCACIDKETSYPFLLCGLDLYEITGDRKYLVCAEKTAYYFYSWAYHYDVLTEEDSEFHRYGYYTTGGTGVSTQHPAIDPWGEIAVPDFIRLWRLTGDERWLCRARLLWNNAILCITTDKEGSEYAGHHRPYGCQSEAFFPARWGRAGYCRDIDRRGRLNDVYVGWVAAYRLWALDRLSGMENGWDLLR